MQSDETVPSHHQEAVDRRGKLDAIFLNCMKMLWKNAANPMTEDEKTSVVNCSVK